MLVLSSVEMSEYTAVLKEILGETVGVVVSTTEKIRSIPCRLSGDEIVHKDVFAP